MLTRSVNNGDYLDLRDLPVDISESYLPYKPTLRQEQKAYVFSRNSYVNGVKLFKDKTDYGIQISAKVYRSQRKSESPHNVNMTLNTATKTLTDGYCSCKAGISGECSHLLATLMTLRQWILEGYKEVPAEQTCTSLPQTWDKPRGPKINPEPISQMVLSNPTCINRKRRPLIAAFHDNRKLHITDDKLQRLRKMEGSPVSYMAQVVNRVDTNETYGPQHIGSGLSYDVPLMNPVEPPSSDHQPCGELLFPNDLDIELPSIVTDNTDQWANLQLSDSQCTDIEKETRNQSDSIKWKELRQCRLTASNFGKIMKRKLAITNIFLKSIFKSQEFVSKATSYGKVNEKVARRMYIKKTGNHVHDIGLIINPKVPFLGATPDGKVCDKGECGILEIKCPYSARDSTLLDMCSNDAGKNFFLKKSGDCLALDVNHAHYYQVQGQLLLSGAKFCDFVTYTRQDCHIQRIYPDLNTFGNLLTKLTHAYIDNVKPYLESDD